MFDEKLVQLLKDYRVEIIDEKRLNDNLDLAVKGILTEKCAGKRCALWGAGRMNTTSSHSAVLIGKYATYLQKLVCIIDSDPTLQGKSFLGFPIIAPEKIKEHDIEIIIISSKNSKDSIISSIQKVAPESKYVDIYSELRKRGLEVYNNFFDENSIYTRIYELQTSLENTSDRDVKEECLHQLIALYFSIRDFYYAVHYMNLYINEKYRDYMKYSELITKVNALLDEIKAINENKTEDISMLYVDALRQIDVIDQETRKPKVLKKYIEKGKVYTNVYSTGATTYESMVSALLGRYPMECQVYTDNFLRDFSEIDFLNYVEDKGYSIHWMVSDCYRLVKDDTRLSMDIQIYMSKKLWNLACTLAEASGKTFNFVYFPYEIHCPMLCGYHKQKPVIRGFSNMGIEHFPESIKQQHRECIEYMDKQFDFYYNLIGSNTTKVIFSDHSQVVYDKDNRNKTYNMYYKNVDLTVHIPFIISARRQEQQYYDEFLSMVDFNRLIISIINDIDFSGLYKEIIRYQYYPIHSAKIRLHDIENGYEDYIDGMDIFASKDYIYIRTGTGKEEVYRHTNLSHNLIDTEEGKSFRSEVVAKYNISI